MLKKIVINGVFRSEVSVGEAHPYQYIGVVNLRNAVQENNSVIVPQWGEVEGGFQRPREDKRVKSMGEYLSHNKPVHGTLIFVIPNADNLSFEEGQGTGGVLTINTEEEGSVWVTDGQHRWGGVEEYVLSLGASEDKEILAACEVYGGLTAQEAAEMFQVTNTEAKGISRSLLAHVRQMCPAEGGYGMAPDEMMAANFYAELGSEGSPLHGLIWDGKKSGRLGLDTFLRAVLSPRTPEKSVLGISGKFGKDSEDKRKKVLRGFLTEVGRALGDNRNEMARAGVFRSLIAVYPEVMMEASKRLRAAKENGEDTNTAKEVRDILSVLKGWTSKTLMARSQKVVEVDLRRLLFPDSSGTLGELGEYE